MVLLHFLAAAAMRVVAWLYDLLRIGALLDFAFRVLVRACLGVRQLLGGYWQLRLCRRCRRLCERRPHAAQLH
jgi:hypothetical protein